MSKVKIGVMVVKKYSNGKQGVDSNREGKRVQESIRLIDPEAHKRFIRSIFALKTA